MSFKKSYSSKGVQFYFLKLLVRIFSFNFDGVLHPPTVIRFRYVRYIMYVRMYGNTGFCTNRYAYVRTNSTRGTASAAASSMAAKRSNLPSSSLEKEAFEMESKLRLLRSRLSELKEEDDAVPRKGGARWKSARGVI